MHSAWPCPVRLGVLGDSDSHSYRDSVRGVRRGGIFHDVTLQWTDVLTQTRGHYLDMGAVRTWGTRGIIARLRARLGLEARTPRKLDYRYNYALSGARCASLGSAWPGQAQWLASAIRSRPGQWTNGIVVIKIGVNDLGQKSHLDQYARTGITDAERALITACAQEISRAVETVREAGPTVRIVVVGVADDSSWPPDAVPWRSSLETTRIRSVLDLFDQTVRSAVSKPGVVFMDDRRWYYDHWSDRDSRGQAQVSGRNLGGAKDVTNTRGDEPVNLMLADGHAGTIANGFWARHLIRMLNDTFGTAIPPLLDAEIAQLADPSGAYGIAPPQLIADRLPVRIEIPFDGLSYSHSELPVRLPAHSARDTAGTDVSMTSTAWLTPQNGIRIPLFGDGTQLQLRPERHLPGTYQLEIQALDASQQTAVASVPLAIA